jgi:trehalose 6-phosphate phosphatase
MKHCFSVLSQIEATVGSAQRVLIAADFDGTLCATASHPSEVWLPERTLLVLRELLQLTDVSVAVISGRALDDLAYLLPPEIPRAGNHGLEIEGPGIEFVHADAVAMRQELAARCNALAAVVSRWPGAWVENKGLSATLHYRNVDSRYVADLLFTARQSVSSSGREFAFRSGLKALEIRPNIGWSKGEALLYMREKLGPFDVCIALGDDRTDEQMFVANKGGINVLVGQVRSTAADLHLMDPVEVREFLTYVAEFRRRAGEPPAVWDNSTVVATGA